MRQIKVSVLIPAYNQAKYLGKAIQSVLDQTFTNFELIIVNDGSSDGTDDIVKSFVDPRIKYIVHDQNKGLAATRNTGIRASSGEFVAFLDLDDFFHPEKLKIYMDYVAEHSDVSALYNSRFELNHSQTTIRELWRPPESISLADLVLGFPFAPSDLLLKRDWLNSRRAI